MVVAPCFDSLRQLYSAPCGLEKEGVSYEKLCDAFALIQPNFASEDFEARFKAADMDGDGLLNEAEFTAFLTRTSGRELPVGNVSDLGLTDVQGCVRRILDLRPEDHCLEIANSLMPSLETAAALLAPAGNPNAYRTCQDAFIQNGSIRPLLSLARHAPSDAVRAKATEVLIWLAFGNDLAAATIIASPTFLPLLQYGLKSELYPQQLTLLQLVQAVVSSRCGEVSNAVPILIYEVAPLISSQQPFQAIVEVALDVLVSSSFHCPGDVAQAMSWSLLATMLEEESGSCLPASALNTLVRGFLAVNLLGEPEPSSDSDKPAQQLMIARLAGGRFMEYLVLATEAAAAHREWPLGSGAHHSPGRLALIASTLASHGYSHRLSGLIEPFVQVVSSSDDHLTVHNVLGALLSLCKADVECLERMLGLKEFRNTRLAEMQGSDGQPHATALYIYTANIEAQIAQAQAALQTLQGYCSNAPQISDLAKVFIRFAPLDCDLLAEQVLQALPHVPIGPSLAVQTAILGEGKPRRFDFRNFAEHVYGTPELLGLWPSLMEDAAAVWHCYSGLTRLPDLIHLLELFDRGARGGEIIDAEHILDEVLPAAGLPVSSTDDITEEDFSTLKCEGPFNFKQFVRWMCDFCEHVAEADAAAAAAIAQAGAVDEEASHELAPPEQVL